MAPNQQNNLHHSFFCNSVQKYQTETEELVDLYRSLTYTSSALSYRSFSDNYILRYSYDTISWICFLLYWVPKAIEMLVTDYTRLGKSKRLSEWWPFISSHVAVAECINSGITQGRSLPIQQWFILLAQEWKDDHIDPSFRTR